MNDIKNLVNVGKSFMEQHNCKICHGQAKHYVDYKNVFAFLCDKRECNFKFEIQSGIFKTEIELNQKVGE